MKERKIVAVSEGSKFFSVLSQSANRQYLSGTIKSENSGEESILSVNINTGKIQTLLTWNKDYYFSIVDY